jgi:hypothetical protein
VSHSLLFCPTHVLLPAHVEVHADNDGAYPALLLVLCVCVCVCLCVCLCVCACVCVCVVVVVVVVVVAAVMGYVQDVQIGHTIHATRLDTGIDWT